MLPSLSTAPLGNLVSDEVSLFLMWSQQQLSRQRAWHYNTKPSPSSPSSPSSQGLQREKGGERERLRNQDEHNGGFGGLLSDVVFPNPSLCFIVVEWGYLHNLACYANMTSYLKRGEVSMH